MTEVISRYRENILARRQRRADGRNRKAFKDSSRLAHLYTAGFFVLMMGMAAAFHTDFFAKAGDISVWWNEKSWQAVSAVINTACSLIIMQAMLRCTSRETLRRNSRVLLCLMLPLAEILGICLIVFATTRIMPNPASEKLAYIVPTLYPFSVAPTLGSLLFGAPAGIAVGIGTALLLTLFPYMPGAQGGIPCVPAYILVLMGMLAAVVMPYFTRRCHNHRTLLLRLFAGQAILIAPLVFLWTQRLVGSGVWQSMPIVGGQLFGLLFNSIFYTAVISALLPFFEHLFARCSDIRLNAFADLSHPLLKRLAMEAPGTYSHSMSIAQLAENAAEAIRANPLLARVGSYYHDIGKLAKPEMFIENTTPELNPHTNLSPSTSANWIRAHIKDGVTLASKYHLPPKVIDIIWAHHGTTVIAYFLKKARDAAEAQNKALPPGAPRIIVDESQFRYNSPTLPNTREAAIIMFADSIEAAARSLGEITPAKLNNLVNRICDGKIQDGQLVDAPLTFEELEKIKKSFIASLQTIYHARIRYPDEKSAAPAPDAGGTQPAPDATPAPAH